MSGLGNRESMSGLGNREGRSGLGNREGRSGLSKMLVLMYNACTDGLMCVQMG